jgi:hypothetical protein
LFLRQISLCSPGWPVTHPSYIHLPTDGIIGMYNHTWLFLRLSSHLGCMLS